MNWTTTKDLTKQVNRLWERGLILRSVFPEEALFPKRLTLKTPTSSDLTHAFDDVRAWCAALSGMRGIRWISREVRHRVTGTNTYPAEAWVDTAEDAVALIGKTPAWQQFNQIVKTTQQRRPELLAWIQKRPHAALAAYGEWNRYLDLVDWIRRYPRPEVYLRLVDLPGIDTKFIEAHRGVLSELFDLGLPSHLIDDQFSGVNGFCRRYGFREKPERIRFRVLDPKHNPLGMSGHPDITLNIGTFADIRAAAKELPKVIFITENEINYLAFPEIEGSWIIFGAGYGFAALSYAAWMAGCRILYWGDIDTHGFAVLNELRRVFPFAESFLMDRATLLAHRTFWGTEPSPSTATLSRLERKEAALYDDLKYNRIAPKLRLEQERVSYSTLCNQLLALGFEIHECIR